MDSNKYLVLMAFFAVNFNFDNFAEAQGTTAAPDAFVGSKYTLKIVIFCWEVILTNANQLQI